MAITSHDQFIDAMANRSQHVTIAKASVTSQVANFYTSLWRSAGEPALPSIPTTPEIPSNASTGAAKFTNPTGGRSSYISRLFCVSSVASTDVHVFDRLAHMGGLSGNSTAVQDVNLSVAGTNNNLVARKGASDYSDVRWFLEWHGQTNSVTMNITITYTNGGGVSGRTTTVAYTGTHAAGRTEPIMGIDGEPIRSIETIALGTSTGALGNIGVVAVRPLTSVSLGAVNSGVVANAIDLGLPKVEDSACLFFMLLPGGTTSGILNGSMKIIQG